MGDKERAYLLQQFSEMMRVGWRISPPTRVWCERRAPLRHSKPEICKSLAARLPARRADAGIFTAGPFPIECSRHSTSKIFDATEVEPVR